MEQFVLENVITLEQLLNQDRPLTRYENIHNKDLYYLSYVDILPIPCIAGTIIALIRKITRILHIIEERRNYS